VNPAKVESTACSLAAIATLIAFFAILKLAAQHYSPSAVFAPLNHYWVTFLAHTHHTQTPQWGRL
jgi:hypothetical protein